MRVLKTLVPALFIFSVFAINVNAQDNKKKNDVFAIVEEMPVYPGGKSAIRNDIAKLVKYPEVAKKNGIQGKVYVTFVVTEQGKIADAKIARGVDASLDKEALRVMNSLDKTWTPGKEKGKAVKVSYTVPINFALGEGKSSDKMNEASTMNGDVFFIVENMPKFPGGDEALRKHIAENVKYPDVAKKNGIQGKVYISFVVDVDGSVIDAKIARGVDPSLDKESIRVVSGLPEWTPGKQKGKAVKVAYTIPINFALDSGKSSDCKKTSYSETEDAVFFIVEEMPEFPGGDDALKEYIAKHVNYPDAAKKNGIQGKVYVSFVVDVDGSVIDAKIARGVDPTLDKESLRVIGELPKWTPGKQRGKAVKVAYTVPINYALDKEKKS